MPRRPKRRIWMICQTLFAVLAVLVLLFMGVAPLVETWLPWDAGTARVLEWTRSRVMEGVLALWFMALGSMVGSFMNVVVWRMPRGVSVVSRGSACPYCCTPIRLSDNIPVFGWIKLGGRCRACRLPISPRYPIVEAIYGLAFLVLFLSIVATGGRTFPGEALGRLPGILPNIITVQWPVVMAFAWFALLVTLLLGWGLMAFDASRIPVKTIVFAVGVGFCGTAFMESMPPVPWIPGQEGWLAELPWIKALGSGFVGLAVGFLVGEFIDQTAPASADPWAPGYFRVTMLTVGLFLGWQGLALAALFAGLISLILSFAAARIPVIGVLPPVMALAPAVIVLACCWRWLDQALVAVVGREIGSVVVGLVGIGLLIWSNRVAGVRSMSSGPVEPNGEERQPA